MSPSKNSERPETDYERWLREHKPGFEPGDQPIYHPFQEDVLEAGSENVQNPIHDKVNPAEGQVSGNSNQNLYGKSHGYFIMPANHHEPAVSRYLGGSFPVPGSYSSGWVVLGGLVVMLVTMLAIRTKRKRHVCRCCQHGAASASGGKNEKCES
ncbi:hypothetical protein BJY04DRAFT_222081 [Aspergillus karnatakaensis]|uniref:uncharacterized protein n=1 Tax=Aspergillus karnatakaensis TaxID=1810916 RepID=UPI003CCD4782